MLASGQIISHYGDGLSPYAEAIISQYVNVVPFYLNVPTGLQGSTDEHTVVVSQPWKYDVLILGAYVDGCIVGDSDDTVITEDGDTVITEDSDTVVTEEGGDVEGSCYGQQIFMQVADQRSLLDEALDADLAALEAEFQALSPAPAEPASTSSTPNSLRVSEMSRVPRDTCRFGTSKSTTVAGL